MNEYKEKIACMRAGGKILAATFNHISQWVTEGISASQVDNIVKIFIEKEGAQAGFLGYQGYKYSTCISKNEEIVHGLPLSDKIFYDGDIVSIDIGVKYKGYNLDAARTFLIGNVDDKVKHLVMVTEQAFFKSLEGISSRSRLGDIGYAMQKYIEDQGLTVVKDLYSHGIGKNLHEDPLVPNYGKKGTGMLLSEGMTIAIEPMVNLGVKDIVTLDDSWTIITKDLKWSAHYENTILVRKNDVEILTLDY